MYTTVFILKRIFLISESGKSGGVMIGKAGNSLGYIQVFLYIYGLRSLLMALHAET